MGAATVIEKYKGTDFVSSHVYGAWWFTLLWALLAAVAAIWIARRRMRRWPQLSLHISFLIILAGALLTHLTAEKGMIHLRMGETTDTYYENNGIEGVAERRLPFALRLDSFVVRYYGGTATASDYESAFTITDGKSRIPNHVSMNRIASYKSVRFYQSSFDKDRRGSILAINSDPWGIPVTYTGYALLFISLLWMLADPKGAYRRLLRNPMMKRGTLLAVTALAMPAAVCHAVTAMPRETAGMFGRLNMLYNDRICPVQTFAIDFTKKLHGSASYNGLNAEQVLTGWIFWGEEWATEPFIKLKDGPLKETLQLPDHVSLNTFFNSDMGGYIIGPYVREYYQGNHDKFHKQAADIDDKIQLIMELRRGTILKVFPYTADGETVWYAPTDGIPDAVGHTRRLYMQNVFPILYRNALAGDFRQVDTLAGKMYRYQLANAGSSLPSPIQMKAERAYNAIPFATILFMVNLTMGLITLLTGIYRLTTRGSHNRRPGLLRKTAAMAAPAVMGLSFAALTCCETLRWIISGNVPMANGYETMLFMAWLVMLLSMVACSRFRIALSFGFLMSGFFLLVSHISRMDPDITNIMPVLNSPLLSIHVSIIMLAFALLSLTFICGVAGLMIKGLGRLRGSDTDDRLKALQLLSRLFLYPAMAALGLGIFIGAIWANVSWGQYWAWDPKEVWALITLMVYAVAAHTDTVPALRNPLIYHTFMTIAFTTILMTYFGVNYFLGGMHSYA